MTPNYGLSSDPLRSRGQTRDSLRSHMRGLTIVFSAVGLLFVGLAGPMIRRRVKANALHGLRVPATYAAERVWYEANAQSGRDLRRLGVLLVVLAMLLPLVPGIPDTVYAMTIAAALGIGAVFCTAIGWTRARR